jgi:hypothetical protein
MHVHREIDAGPVHLVADAKHFRASLGAGLVPLAVEVGADRIGPEMAAARSVGIHVGDDVEGGLRPQASGNRVGLVEQPLERSFHPPLRHRLAGMLAGVEPDLERPVSDPEIIHLLAVQGPPKRAVAGGGMGGHRGDQVLMALHRIGCEIGEPHIV